MPAVAMGRKRRSEPEVPAAIRSDSGVIPKVVLLFQSVLVTFARFLLAGPSSPSVPSSYPDVLPPTAAAFGFLALGLFTDTLEDGREVFLAFSVAVVVPLLSFPEFSAFTFTFELLTFWGTGTWVKEVLNGSCIGGCWRCGLRSWFITSILIPPRWLLLMLFMTCAGGRLFPMRPRVGFACRKEFHSLASPPVGMVLLISLYFSIVLTYSPCNIVGTGTSLSLTSRVSFTPFVKMPRIFLQTRPVISCLDWFAGASSVGEAVESALDSIPCPTRGLSYSE